MLAPPRHGKSILLSQIYPAWFLLVYPWRRVILCSYEAGFAAQWGRKVRDLVIRWGPAFGVQVADDSKAADRWEIVKHGGGMQTAGRGGPILGKGADLLIMDDLLKNAEEAMSPTVREHTWDWIVSTAYSRLEPGGAVLHTAQRWHSDDPTGRFRANEPGKWVELEFTALAEPGDVLKRPLGAALWPERYDVAALEEKRRLSPTWFAAQYQQKPIDLEGGFFRGLERIEIVGTAPTADQFTRRVRAWDLACFVAGTMVATSQGEIPIEQVRAGDMVWTRAGLRHVKWSGQTKTAPVMSKRMANGRILTGTQDHRIWTENRGWSPLCDIIPSDCTTHITGGYGLWGSNPSSFASPTRKFGSFRASFTPEGPARSISRHGGMTLQSAARLPMLFTAPSGGTTTVRSLPATTFTTSTATTTTTSLKTCQSSRGPSTPNFTTTSPRSIQGQTRMSSGSVQERSDGQRPRIGTTSAWSVPRIFSLGGSISRPSSVASDAAETSTGGLVVPVYDLEVEGEHEFFANGTLVHNCTEASTGADPDWTVGALVGRHKDGTFWLLDLVRQRLGPQGVRNLIKQTAELDGVEVPIRIEREGGSSGKMAAQSIVADDLAGFAAAAVTPKGNKAERAEPWGAQIEAGNVRWVKGEWNKAVMDEHRSFPLGSHDDAVDACSLSFSQVSRAPAFIMSE